MVKQNHAQWMCLILFSRTGISPYSYSSLLVHTWYGVFGCLAPSFLSCVNSQKYGFFIFFFSLRSQLSIFFVLLLNSAPRVSTIYRLSHSPLVSTKVPMYLYLSTSQRYLCTHTEYNIVLREGGICPGWLSSVRHNLLYTTILDYSQSIRWLNC